MAPILWLIWFLKVSSGDQPAHPEVFKGPALLTADVQHRVAQDHGLPKAIGLPK